MARHEEKYGITYRQYPVVGKTIATLSGCSEDAMQIIDKVVRNNSNQFCYCPREITDLPLMDSSYRGIVVCNTVEGDVYDEKVGRKEAYKKVMNKYHKDLDRNLRKALKDARELCAGLEHYMDKKGIEYDTVENVEQLKTKKFGSYQG